MPAKKQSKQPEPFNPVACDLDTARFALRCCRNIQDCERMGITHDLQQAMLAADVELHASQRYIEYWLLTTQQKLAARQEENQRVAALIEKLRPVSVPTMPIDRITLQKAQAANCVRLRPGGEVASIFENGIRDGESMKWVAMSYGYGWDTHGAYCRVIANRLTPRAKWKLPVIGSSEHAPYTRYVGWLVSYQGQEFVLGEAVDFYCCQETHDERRERLAREAVTTKPRRKKAERPVPVLETLPAIERQELNLFGELENS